MKSTNDLASSDKLSFWFTTKNVIDIEYVPCKTLSSLASTPSIFTDFISSLTYPKDIYPIAFLFPSIVDLTAPDPSQI